MSNLIKVYFTRFCQILDMAGQRFGRADSEAAVALAQIAGRYAFPGNVSLFASPWLERLLISIRQSLPVSAIAQGRTI